MAAKSIFQFWIRCSATARQSRRSEEDLLATFTLLNKQNIQEINQELIKQSAHKYTGKL